MTFLLAESLENFIHSQTSKYKFLKSRQTRLFQENGTYAYISFSSVSNCICIFPHWSSQRIKNTIWQQPSLCLEDQGGETWHIDIRNASHSTPAQLSIQSSASSRTKSLFQSKLDSDNSDFCLCKSLLSFPLESRLTSKHVFHFLGHLLLNSLMLSEKQDLS